MTKAAYAAKALAERCQVPLRAVRRYAKLGLVPFVVLRQCGRQCYNDKDIDWIKELFMLEKAGFSDKELVQYTQWVRQGERALEERLALLFRKQDEVGQKINQLHEVHDFLYHKIAACDFLCHQQKEAKLIQECLSVLVAERKLPS